VEILVLREFRPRRAGGAGGVGGVFRAAKNPSPRAAYSATAANGQGACFTTFVPPALRGRSFRSAKTATTSFLARLGGGFATFVLTETNQIAMKNPRSLPDLSKAGRRLTASFGLWLAVAVLGVVGQKAQAAAVTAADVAASNALGDAPGNLWVTANVTLNGQNANYNFTAFPIGKQVDTLGNTIKTFFYFPEHAIKFDGAEGTITGVGDGKNFMTNPGHVFQNVQIEYRGGFDNTKQWLEDKDIVIASTTTDISGLCFLPLAPEGAASSLIGQTATATGFDRLRIDGVLQPMTGDSYGFNGKIDTSTGNNVNSEGYKSLYFSLSDSIPVHGMSLTGGSGSRITDAAFTQVYGAAVATISLPGFQAGYTDFADFTATGYRNQVLPFWGVQVISNFFPLIITAQTNFGFASQQFRFTLTGPAGSNAVIAASTNLQTWSPLYTNTLVGGSLNFTDTLATNYLRRFYRAKLQ
jgi:hypothetical protein